MQCTKRTGKSQLLLFDKGNRRKVYQACVQIIYLQSLNVFQRNACTSATPYKVHLLRHTPRSSTHGSDHRNTHTAVECWDDEDDSESQLPDVADAPPGTALVGS
jgi:hypothetical protein